MSRKRKLRFECTGCGGCCVGRPNSKLEYYVAVTPAERERIRKFLGVSPAWFRRRYLQRFDDGQHSLRWNGDRCVFLDGEKRCRIYPVRPTQCVTYPFWPEIVESRFGWRAEARHCEGINRGAAVPLVHVRRQLARQRRALKLSFK
ncbi:MAG: YkgJ family cysteine cluster protein [Gammaproteobacteria bacterium]|nr:MAG: YkgJ family cysteine cluster protein [Gammaproteobacteria bacterium]